MAHRQSGCPFVEAVRRAIRVRHYSLRTEDACPGWIKRFILFHGTRHPAQMGESKNNRGQTPFPCRPLSCESRGDKQGRRLTTACAGCASRLGSAHANYPRR